MRKVITFLQIMTVFLATNFGGGGIYAPTGESIETRLGSVESPGDPASTE